MVGSTARKAWLGIGAAVVALMLGGSGAMAQGLKADPRPGAGQKMYGEKYIPTIWIDPDGCEHWVMDDGAEGYMDIRLDRSGKPICHRGKVCKVINSDVLFATDSAVVSAEGRRRLTYFFTHAGAYSYEIDGHTDSRASDAYNMALSMRRANSVAAIARSVGARVTAVRGYGKRMPIASNATAAGMQKNRRVEIECIR